MADCSQRVRSLTTLTPHQVIQIALTAAVSARVARARRIVDLDYSEARGRELARKRFALN